VNGTQALIAIGYAVLVVASIGALVWLVRTTRARSAYGTDTGELAERETRWGLIVVTLLVTLLALTIFAVPYGKTGADDAQVVRVDSVQFAWQFRPRVVEADRPVEFRLFSRDVNHGFALYNGNRFFAQAQVMPDHEQRLVHTFDEPGTYRVLCLEFCGLGHHLMASRLEVRP
jgi:cytochrome c oxidase subunit II